jgi:predicted DNA-binding ribbon-helix-helix protein
MQQNVHSVKVDGRTTSINAEPEFWEQFRLIVMERGTTISELLAEIDRKHRLLPYPNAHHRVLALSAALRVFVLQELMAKLADAQARATRCPSALSTTALARGIASGEGRQHRARTSRALEWRGLSQDLLVIRRNHRTGVASLDPLRWGLIPYLCQDPTSGRKPNNAKLETLVRQFVQMCFDTSNPTSRRDNPMSRNMESSRLSNSLRERRCCHHSPRTWFN